MICFTQEAWEHYVYWEKHDKKKFKKINRLIKECSRLPYEGIGKPEPLKGDFSGFWSRRISDSDRFVYRFEQETLYILSCRFHYDD